MVSYYFVPVLQSAGINGGLQIFNWLMVILASLFVDKVGRRKLFLGSSIGMLVTLIAVAICNERFLATGNKSAGYCMILFLFLFNGAYDFAYSSLPTLYTAEIHPLDLSAKGVSVSLASTFGFGLFNQYVNHIALEASKCMHYCIFDD
jgi:MFS family permease